MYRAEEKKDKYDSQLVVLPVLCTRSQVRGCLHQNGVAWFPYR